ncbi:MAG: hypothetical protein C0418_02420 [Coriobacteriaceae bacterium]|nr:hypothetical protein [Coriobacteriaceae bacterium]
MAKVNIYIPDEMLERIDADASAAGRSRSSVVQEAVGEYTGRRRTANDAAELEAGVRRALETMDRISEQAAAADPYPDVSNSEFLAVMRESRWSLSVDEAVAIVRGRRGDG